MDKIINNILLIDDDEVSNFISQTALEQFGYSNTITTALDANQALAYLKNSWRKKNLQIS